jgi:signal transduction histidine kinase
MQTNGQRWATSEGPAGEPDAAVALCHEIHQPLTYLLVSLDRAREALQQRLRDGDADQPTLYAARSLADAYATAQHLVRVVGEVHDWAGREPRQARRLDLRAVVRAAAAMVQPGGPRESTIAVDGPDAVWIDGDDTRLVHVVVTLFAEALHEETALVASVRASGGEVFVELCHGGADRYEDLRPITGPGALSRALGRSLVCHIVRAHGGRLERWPELGPGVTCRVTLPAARE